MKQIPTTQTIINTYTQKTHSQNIERNEFEMKESNSEMCE